MEKNKPHSTADTTERITSVDFFRGFTMFLLIGESTGMFEHVNEINNGFFHFFGNQLTHHEWHGLHFWDLIQPFFMFIVGVAIPFAVANRKRKGATSKSLYIHALKRSALLLFFGLALYTSGEDKIVFRLQNVLAQLSFTYLVAFLIMQWNWKWQFVFSLLLLLGIDLAYRFFPVAGFNQPWEPFQNLGSWVNNWIEGVDKASIWASLNAIPTTAHTIWGVLCGMLLMSTKTTTQKIQILLIAGISGLVIGFGLDLLSVTPIIKKIATSSFVFASGGWAILALAVSYWIIDVKKNVAGSKFFIVVGMNCIFIYLIFEVGASRILADIYKPFISQFFSWSGPLFTGILISAAVWASLWYVCYWLYVKKIFFKILEIKNPAEI
jgi:predicted acyltransferase